MTTHVLVPVDGSSRSDEALAFALEQYPSARVTVLHVVEPVSPYGYAGEDAFDYEAYTREATHREGQAEKLLEGYQQQAADYGTDVETTVEMGKPTKAILSSIDELGVDHVVIGSRGRSGVGRVVFGSVAETVTRRSPVPVTIV